MLMDRDKSWYEERLVALEDHVRKRLGELADCLGDADWLDGEFSAGDLMMMMMVMMVMMVLRRLEDGPNLLEEFPNLLAYVARGEARPAYKRAFEAQRAVFIAASRSH